MAMVKEVGTSQDKSVPTDSEIIRRKTQLELCFPINSTVEFQTDSEGHTSQAKVVGYNIDLHGQQQLYLNNGGGDFLVYADKCKLNEKILEEMVEKFPLGSIVANFIGDTGEVVAYKWEEIRNRWVVVAKDVNFSGADALFILIPGNKCFFLSYSCKTQPIKFNPIRVEISNDETKSSSKGEDIFY